MSGVVLELDLARWREHLATVATSTPGIVPVAKGNGYGFGLARLAAEAQRIGADTLAVGVPAEVEAVRKHFPGDLVVMTPWRPDDPEATRLLGDPRVITTVSRIEDLAAIADGAETTGTNRPRVLLELLTSMRRHGLSGSCSSEAAALVDAVTLAGWTIHLPLADEGRYAEAERLARVAMGTRPAPLWISHLPVDDATALARQLGGASGEPAPMRLRVGTRLWLGSPTSMRSYATVLDVHPVARGERAGYRHRRCWADGWVVVMAGGTAHGVGLEAPTPAASSRQRAVSVATGGLAAAGLALSPFSIAGKKRWFLEPPHMQASLVFLPRSVPPPAVGDRVPVELRLTTAAVDRIEEI